MRVVFDTSVLVSALQFGGAPRQALLRIATGAEHQICISDTILLEMRQVLHDRFAWTSDSLDTILTLYFGDALRVVVQATVKGVCRDSKDDMVLETSLLTDADRLVTGDKDLLVLEWFHNTRIVSVRTFLDELKTAM